MDARAQELIKMCARSSLHVTRDLSKSPFTGPRWCRLPCFACLLLVGTGAAWAAPLNPATGLTAHAASTTQIDLNWTDNSANETGFELQRRTYGGTWATIATLPVNTASYADTGLTPLATYLYRVRPFNDAGPAAYWSNEAWADTTLPPAAPSGLQGRLNAANQLELSWTDNSDDERAFTIFWRGDLPESTFERIGTVPPNTTRFTCPDWMAKSPVVFRVRATGTAGASDWSNEWSWIHPNAPPAPTGLTATAISSRLVELRWNSSGLEQGEIRIQRTVDGWWIQLEEMPMAEGSWRDLRCRPGITYYYRVYVVVNGLSSRFSSEVKVMTPPEP